MELKVPKIAIFGVKGVPYGGVFQMGVHGLNAVKLAEKKWSRF